MLQYFGEIEREHRRYKFWVGLEDYIEYDADELKLGKKHLTTVLGHGIHVLQNYGSFLSLRNVGSKQVGVSRKETLALPLALAYLGWQPFCCNRGVWLLLKRYPNTPVAAERVFDCSSLFVIEFFKSKLQLPWWAFLLACGLAFFFTLLSGVITATTNQVKSLNGWLEYIVFRTIVKIEIVIWSLLPDSVKRVLEEGIDDDFTISGDDMIFGAISPNLEITLMDCRNASIKEIKKDSDGNVTELNIILPPEGSLRENDDLIDAVNPDSRKEISAVGDANMRMLKRGEKRLFQIVMFRSLALRNQFHKPFERKKVIVNLEEIRIVTVVIKRVKELDISELLSIIITTQEDGEFLFDTWERYNDLLFKCPFHDPNDHQKVNTFYNGLNSQTRRAVDSNGLIPGLTASDALKSIQKLVEHSHKWHCEENHITTPDPFRIIIKKLKLLNHEMEELKVDFRKLNTDDDRKSYYAEVKSIRSSKIDYDKTYTEASNRPTNLKDKFEQYLKESGERQAI
ncbi:callose synthase 9 [Tanacetum coccineum]